MLVVIIAVVILVAHLVVQALQEMAAVLVMEAEVEAAVVIS